MDNRKLCTQAGPIDPHGTFRSTSCAPLPPSLCLNLLNKLFFEVVACVVLKIKQVMVAPPTISAKPRGSARDPDRGAMSWSDEDARKALDRYEGLVQTLSRRLLPLAASGRALDRDDLVAEGRVAVLEALSRYKGFGIPERIWVKTRIRQRMIDTIRKYDLRSREELRLCRQHAQGESNESDEERGRELRARRLVSLTSRRGDEPVSLRDEHAPSAEQLSYMRSRMERLLEALGQIPERQRDAFFLGVFEGLGAREISGRMGVSESRVCQLQKRAVERIRLLIANDTSASSVEEQAVA